jgi:DNA-binding transcriptional MerR regulator
MPRKKKAETKTAESKNGSENGDKRTYFQGYYEKNREKLSEKRRERYRTDEKYREQVKQRAMDRYMKQREERLKELEENPQEPRVRGNNFPRVAKIDGEDVLVHGVSEFASRVGRNVQTITAWENKGIIPPPTVKDELGRRWYTEKHMDSIASLARDYRAQGGRSLKDFKELIDASFGGSKKSKSKRKA